MAKGDPSHEQVLVESICFYVFAFLFFVGRIWSRVITTGSIKRLASDDYVMVITFLFYTALIPLLNFNTRLASNLMDEDELEGILADPAQVESRIFGSKITVAVEQCMIHCQWGTKLSLLILYHRMTQGLRENFLNKLIAGYVFFGYIFIQITFFGVWCRPFNQYWALPPDNPQCSHYGHYCITILIFNTSSDILMFLIPIPLIWKAQMKLKKKLMLCAVFSLGLFNVVAAVLNKTYNWILPGSRVYMIWYVRESSTGIYVANATCCWPLFRTLLSAAGLGGSWTNSATRSRTGGGGGNAKYVYDEHGNKTSAGSKHKSLHKSSQRFSHLRSLRDRTLHSLHSSAAPDDHDATQPSRQGSDGSEQAFNNHIPLEIWRHVDYDIETGMPRTPSMYADEAGGYVKEVGSGGGGKGEVLGLRSDVSATVTEVRGGAQAQAEEGRGHRTQWSRAGGSESGGSSVAGEGEGRESRAEEKR